jgi:hypothetical protein
MTVDDALAKHTCIPASMHGAQQVLDQQRRCAGRP